MKINGTPWRTIWLEADRHTVGIIDQTKLPHQFVVAQLRTADDAIIAIRDMLVRGAPLIGAAAAYGVFLGLLADSSDAGLEAV
ncbi:S-methyl-5-thioribose-1-phosphate isomerase, partial [Desulfobulbus sp. F3]|nr:S-methyl-5-thioribose-1-phosphate isomerase [Desulfobulbus sp. F3]